MTEPSSLAEYLYLIRKNRYVEEVDGLTVIHQPCPFCASAEWMTYDSLTRIKTLARGAKCEFCKRSARGLFADSSGISFEMVQSGGPEQPDWFEGRVRVVYNGNH